MSKLLFLFIVSYLVGSFPTGYLSVKLLQGIDIRDYGSGNTGATNVFRVAGTKAALITAVGDVGKGILALQLAKVMLQEPLWGLEPKTALLICGIIVIAGHNWSIFLRFEGGKGVATTGGVLIALIPYMIWILLVIWLSLVVSTRYVSIASMVSGIAIPVFMLVFREPGEYVLFGIVIAIFVLYRHRSNIQRLLAGNENRLDWSQKGKKKRVR